MSKSFTIKMDDKELQIKLSKLASKSPIECKRALMDITLDLKSEIQTKRAPIESGELRGSTYAKVTGSDMHMVGEVGVNAPYARRQHEDLSLSHDRTDGYKINTGKNAGKTVNMVAGGEAKYIENPVNENMKKYINRLIQGINKAMK